MRREAKYNVGDKVIILNGVHVDNYLCGWGSGMRPFVGKEATIASVLNMRARDGRIGYYLREYGFTWDERGLESALKPDYSVQLELSSMFT